MRCYLQILKYNNNGQPNTNHFCYSVCFTKNNDGKRKTTCDSINDKPSAFYFCKEEFYSKVWMKNSLHHRLNGPAVINKLRENYLLNGFQYDKKEWEKERLKYKYAK